MAALLRLRRSEANKMLEVDDIVEVDQLDVSPTAPLPIAPPTLRSSGSGCTGAGVPPEGSSPRDLGGVYPQGSDQPPLGVLPDGGPDGAGGDLGIIQAAALHFVFPQTCNMRHSHS